MSWVVCHACDLGKVRRILLRRGACGEAGGADRPRKGKLRHAGQHHPQRPCGAGAGGAGRPAGRRHIAGAAGGDGHHPLPRRDAAGLSAAGGAGRGGGGRHLSQCAAYPAAGGRRRGGGTYPSHHWGAAPSGGAGRSQLVGGFRHCGRPGGTGSVAGGGSCAAHDAPDGSGADHLYPHSLGRLRKNFKKTVYKCENL